MYKIIKDTAFSTAHRFGILSRLHTLDKHYSTSVYVLAYHRVDDVGAQPELDPQNLSTTPEIFDQQMRLISQEYHPVSSDDVLDFIISHKSLPPRSVLITVDDGYLDFKKYIWPIANHYGIRPVLFVPTAYVGTGAFWWDRLYDALQHTKLKQVETPIGSMLVDTKLERYHAFMKLADYMKQSPFDKAFIEITNLSRELFPEQIFAERTTLDWDELRKLAAAGVTLAPHTHNHPALGNITPVQVNFEISESQRLLKSETGVETPLFAYPYGSHEAIGTSAAELLRISGVHGAFTMKQGRANLERNDLMYLPRIPIYPKLSMPQLHAKLTPIFDILRN